MLVCGTSNTSNTAGIIVGHDVAAAGPPLESLALELMTLAFGYDGRENFIFI